MSVSLLPLLYSIKNTEIVNLIPKATFTLWQQAPLFKIHQVQDQDDYSATLCFVVRFTFVALDETPATKW